MEEAYSGRNWNLRYREGSELDTLLEQGARVRHGLRQKMRLWRTEERRGQQAAAEGLQEKGEQMQATAEDRAKSGHHGTLMQRTAAGSAQDVVQGEADAPLASGFEQHLGQETASERSSSVVHSSQNASPARPG